MYYISAKTFNEAFGYSRNSIFNFIKIHQKKELIEKYNVHYGKISRSFFMKIENIQNLNKMNNDFYNKNNILNKENKKKDNDLFRNIFNNIANKKDE